MKRALDTLVCNLPLFTRGSCYFLCCYTVPVAMQGVMGCNVHKNILSVAMKLVLWVSFVLVSFLMPAYATPYTRTVPGTGVALPVEYPEAGGVAIVMTGANGNVYYQFSDPNGAFRGFNFNGQPAAFRGNPFTINNPLVLDCGFSSCSTYFGGSIARIDIRFSAYDGDTQPGGFDENDISLRMNGFNLGSWSGIQSERTNNSGTQSFGFTTGFGNNTFNTAWFSSTNAALLNNILTTGSTTTQVFDDDPNDNYWDFRRGNSLADPTLRTVAPGYTLDKTAHSGSANGPEITTFSAVGDVVFFKYIVTNIGSVQIANLSITDDKVSTITCDKTTINDVPAGSPAAEFATCTGSYVITQADLDAQSVTNIASATGTPEFGVLGTLEDTVTLTGPALSPSMTLGKVATPNPFGAAGSTVTYDLTITNTGNTTLTNVSATDPKLPGLVCSFAQILPLSTENADNTETCSGTYTVTQADVDAFANGGTQLVNTASVSADDPSGSPVSATGTSSVPGLPAAPTLTVAKSAAQLDFDAVGDVIDYTIDITNTGNVTFPAPPTITDVLTGGATCPAGPVAPGATVSCTASYTILQADLDARSVTNTADVSITIGGVTANGTDSVTTNAVVTTGLDIVKQLEAASPTTFNAINTALTYEYILTNTGTVTLQGASVTDDKISVTCPATDILPGASITCTSDPYSTTQQDLDNNGVTNTATGGTTAVGAGEVVTSVPTSLTVPADQQPALTIVKTAPTVLPVDFAPGLVVAYSYEVENSGNVSIADQITITDDHIAGAFNCGTQSLAAPLAVGATVACTANYTVTPQDVANGVVTNIASATDGTTTSPTDTATIPQTGTPALGISKSAAEANFTSLADTLNYTFTVTNTGDTNIVNLTPITVNDPLITDAGGTIDCSAQPATLAPGASFDCTATYSSITQAQMDAGEVANSATASFEYTDPAGGTSTVTSPAGTAVVPANVTPALTLAKTGPAQFDALNQTITYTFTVTNDGLQTLTSVDVTDPLLGGAVCTLTNIAPAANDSCTGTYHVTQADMDAESIANTATANGVTQAGGTATDTDSISTPLNPANATKSMTLSKTADVADFTAVGNVINYTFEVMNSGTQTLTGITVTDPLFPALNCNIASLAPAASDQSCSASYTVTQDDVDAGSRVNTATVTAPGAPNATDGVTVNGPARVASLNFTKVAGGGYNAAGDAVTFTLSVENSGNVRLTGVTVTDAFFDPDLTCNIGTIDPGATDTSCVGTYTVTQADVDAGSITNTAAVSATGADGTPVNDTATEVVNGPAAAPAITIVKTERDGSGTFDALPDTEIYDFAVTNTGNVTLTNIVVTDPLTGFSCSVDDLAPGISAPSCTGGAPLEETVTITQAHIDAGSLSNTATVNAESTLGAAVNDTSTVVLVGPVQNPAMTVAKTATSGTPFDTLGANVTYDYVVTNSGNITLTAPVTIADDKIATVNCPALPAGGLAPAATLTCTATYQITQADLDAGTVTNNASASTSSLGGVITSPNASETVNATQGPELTVLKRVKAGGPSTYAAVNDTVTFEYVVTNSGNVTFTDDITISDDKIPGTLVCSTVDLAPLATVTCEQDWTATQADLTAGSVTNIATADSTFGGTPVASPPDSVTINAVQDPSLAITKSIVAPIPAVFSAGQTLHYEYVVTNDGNVTITDAITVSDNLTAVACDPVPAGGLLPAATLNCTASYVISTGDIALGATTNIASASSTFGGQPVTSPNADAIFPVAAAPALSIVKEAIAGNNFTAVGDVVSYRFTVTNTGGADLGENIMVNDPLLGGAVLCYDTAASGNFVVNAVAVCDAAAPVANPAFDYSVTQADVDRGFITNEATATTTFAPGTANEVNVISPSSTTTVNAVTTPALTVTKDVTTGADPAALNDVLTYTITTTNTGNQTVSGIVVADPLLPALTCTVGGAAAPANIVLAPTEAVICTGDYTVTQDDIDAQDLPNTATATGSNPQGGPVTGSGSDNHPLVPDAPAITVAKAFTSGTPTYASVGEQVEFTVTVTNTGNVTMTSVDVTDDLVAGTCTVGPLAPGQNDNTCTFTYPVTQADIDNGTITNVATGVAQPAVPGEPTVTETGSVTGTGPVQEPNVTLNKIAGAASVNAVGQTITYTYTVANTGNVTVFGTPSVTDDKIGTFNCGAIGAGGLAPNASVNCTADYTVTQADVDAGIVTNVATVGGLTETGGGAVPPSDPVTETVDAARTPGVSVSKTASATANVQVGDVITYTYDVTNTGNVTLTNVAPTDQHTSAAGTVALPIAGDTLLLDNGVAGNSTDSGANGVWDTLGPSDVVRFTSTYTITQADVDANAPITNVVTVSTSSPPGTTPPSTTGTETVQPEAPAPSFEVLKTVSAQSGAAAGDTVTFQVTLENTGNVTVDGITTTDTLKRNDGSVVNPAPTLTLIAGDGGVAGDLEVGETWTYQTVVTLSQADIDAGGINNSVLATGAAPNGDPVTDTSDDGTGGPGGSTPTTVVIAPDPSLEVLKVMSAAPTIVGATVTYDITVKNDGNVTLGSVAISSDTLTRADNTVLALTSGPSFVTADAGSAAGALQVGETATYRATYVLTQEDVDAGGIANSATAIGTPPIGGPVTDTSDDGTGGPGGNTPTTLVIASAPSMTMVKSSSDASFDTLGQVLTFTFTVTNTGNVTLTDPFTVTDPMITNAGGTITCAAPPLAPNATLDCTGDYTVTQADLDAGVINNSATVSDGTSTSPPATETVPAVQNPAMETVKVADPIAPADFIVGATVTYTYTVTNTGNVTLTDPITISDNLIAPADITCPAFPAAGVVPLGTYVCTGSYTVTPNDVALASATNIASASDGTTTSPNTSETVPSGAVPALTIAKTATSGADFTAVGDQITYEYTVTNSGTASFATQVVVNDDKFVNPIVCFDPAGAAGPDLIPGEVVTCTAVYDVTQDDLDAGSVTNQANAQVTFGGTTDVVSPPATVTVDAATDPALTVTKSAATLPITGVGQILTYTINVENSGNQTLTTVTASDPLIPALVCEIAELAPAASFDCTGTYTVLQSDIDAGTLVNNATAEAVNPQGDPVTGTGTLTLNTPAAAPSLVFTKTSSPSPFGAVGSLVTYTFAVENTGNVTLLNVHVTDALDPAYDCTIASIAPSITDNSCTLALTVTQDHVDAGEIVNTASVSSEDPFGTPVGGTDTVTTPGPTRMPSLEATKVAGVVGTSVGTVVPYTLSVENMGNVSLTVTGITDVMTRENATATALDAPFALASGDTDSDGKLDVGETWVYTASHTITQADINAGGFSNTATVNATGPDGAPVSDVSDNGNDGDGNTVDDPTPFPITAAPSLKVTKTVETSGNVAGDTVSFIITSVNTGNVTLSAITVTDTLTRADSTVLTPTSGPVRIASATDNGDNDQEVTEVLSWRVTYVLTQDDIDAGGISNTATVSGTDPGGAPVSDVSDNGNNGDGNIEDDPTVLTITPTPEIDVVKTVVSVGAAAGEEAVFNIAAENTGNVTLTGVVLADTMTNLDGAPLTPTSVAYTGAVDGTLEVGETGTWEVRYTMTQADVDAGGVQNSAVISGTTPGGGIVSDTSDDGDDGDGNTVDDPTVAAIPAVETVTASKTANTPTRIRPDVFVVTFTITIENTGNVTQHNMQVADDLTAFVAPATLLTATDPPVLRVNGFTGGAANGAYDGVGDANLLSGAPELAPGDVGTIEIDVTYDTSTGSPVGTNTVSVTGDRLSTPVTASAPVVTPSADPDIQATKTVSPANAKRGDSVTYTMTFQNNLPTAEAGLTFVDQMPAGLVFTPGTATYNGAATPVPVQAGRRLTWSGITLAPGETVTITLMARVTGGGGSLENRAYVLNPAGDTVSNVAVAVLRIAPEHIFDCSDIIGKVFDDKDMDGYQDQGEPGIAGVRLATVRGVLITTDAYGRYHVPCAELPRDIGSNFTLKLDTRTLPSGYRVTTENPRVVRVTAGKFARLNFGAALSNVVDIDLTAQAFDPKDGKPTQGLKDGVRALVAQLKATPSIIRLSYYRDGEDERTAKARLKLVEDLLRTAWRGQGRYRLLIERTIKRVQ